MDDSISNPLCDVNDDEIEVEDVEKEYKFVEPDKKKTKSTTFDCWKFFTKIGVGKDGKEKAKCNACGKPYVIGGKKYETSYLNCHIGKSKLHGPPYEVCF